MAQISVIIPCYNAGKFIEHTLEALEKQKFQDFDVIMVDDCSTDNTCEVINNYKERSSMQISYSRNETNSGPAFSRNLGITLSNAEYVCFCDSDDWYDENYLSRMMEAAQEFDSDMVLGGYKIVFSDNKPSIEHPLPVKYGAISKKEALTLNVDSLCVLMTRRKIAAECPLPDMRNGEDMAIIPVWMLHAQHFAVIPEAMYNYLLRQGSLSNNVDMRVVNSLVSSFQFIHSHVVDGFMLEIEYIGIRNLVYGALLNLFKCSNDVKRAQKIVADFGSNFPEWRRNPYVSHLPLFKQIFVRSVAAGRFGVVRALAKMHSMLTK